MASRDFGRWTTDERMVAVLCFRLNNGKSLGKTTQCVLDWAERIGRTPDALAMKAGNIIATTPDTPQKGLDSGSDKVNLAERAVWEICSTLPINTLIEECERRFPRISRVEMEIVGTFDAERWARLANVRSIAVNGVTILSHAERVTA
jgi:hypothetical protein